MEVDALIGGEFIGGAAFDVNGDGLVNANDFVKIAGVNHAASGIALGIGITKTPAVVEAATVDFKYLSGSTGQMGIITDTGASSSTTTSSSGGIRRSWQQLK